MSVEFKSRAPTNDPRLAGWTEYPCAVVTAEDGTYQIVTRAQFDADPLAYIATTKPLAQTKREALSKLADIRWEKTQVMVWDGVVTPASPAISALTGAVVAIQTRVPPPSVEWKLAPGEWRTYDLAQLIALGSAMRDHIQACFSHEAVLDAQIQAAATSREVMAIDLTQGWPATSLAEVGG